ncbi:MAG: DUF3016 domain-containing protein [Pseudoxanthomonas sp.]
MKLAPLLSGTVFAGIVLALLVAGPVAAKSRNVTDADAPRSLPAEGPVSVDWTDPAQFSDIRYSGNRWEAERGNWVEQLAQYLQKSALKKLPQGESLQVTITDIKRAGSYEPWHGPNLRDTRIIRDMYPPRMTLTFKRLDARGEVIEQGERKLSDSGFLTGSTRFGDSDPLRYEKSMLDDWLKREFKPDASLSAR